MSPKPVVEGRQNGPELAAIARLARERYMERITRGPQVAWWSVVVVTASSARQAERYRQEIERRRQEGKLPDGVVYLVVADLDDQRIGSGGATLNVLRALARHAGIPETSGTVRQWWERNRALIVHSGGDSRRLPQYSLSGKLFSALPVRTPWGDVSTVLDETLALSTLWAEHIESGLLVCSGDVILTFDARQVNWNRPGITGVGIRQVFEVGRNHGVYAVDEHDRVYSFLQKPSAAQVKAAGALFEDGRVAVDTGLLRFDPAVTARMTALAGVCDPGVPCGPDILEPRDGRRPVIDLYEHFTLALTGELPQTSAGEAAAAIQSALRDTPFWCGVVDGEFTHVGTTTMFRRLLTEENDFSRLYESRERLGNTSPPGFTSAGVVLDCAFSAGGEIGPRAVAIECALDVPVRLGPGAILHGLAGVAAPVEIPADTVVHQVPVLLPGRRRGVVVRVYGVEDDPKKTITGDATWLNRPILESLCGLGLDPELVWPGIPLSHRALWNAALFPLVGLEHAWACARWMMGYAADFSAARWAAAERLSLAGSAEWADAQELAEARTRRLQSNWQTIALSLAESDGDVRPLLAHSPGIAPLAAVGRELARRASAMEGTAMTKAASRHLQASLFLTQAGLIEEAENRHAEAFRCVRKAVEAGTAYPHFERGGQPWRYGEVTVSAPPRIDFGGGWSDTPPFCLDWGGTVLNMAITLNGRYPIRTTVRRLPIPVIRCFCDDGQAMEFHSSGDVLAASCPGSRYAITGTALQMIGLTGSQGSLQGILASAGGGLEIRTAVDLPMGSGLGTSSILAATVLRALSEMLGVSLMNLELSDWVMSLEQRLTTGGGWQDQAGGIFPGAKLISSGPGLRQRLRIQPVAWTDRRLEEFYERVVIYYTGMQRLAKNLLTQVVSRYLAHEPAAVQVLHSIKTLAMEMAHAMEDGEWEYLGALLDRHWTLNQVLDPHTTNAPISALLQELKPFIAGAKLAGAGGGGFLMFVAATPEMATQLRKRLASLEAGGTGALYRFEIAGEGLHVEYRD